MAYDTVDVIIIGVATTVLGAIVVNKFFNGETQGGGEPRQLRQPAYVARGGFIAPQVPPRLPRNAAPLAQNTPITEAAYNVQMTTYEPTLGPNRNAPAQEVTLPI
jgi:hypothetical protein